MNDAQARERLEAERARLQEVRDAADRLAETAAEADASELSTFDQHPADQGTEMFERERDLSVMMQVDQELGEVRDALRRLDEGRYGTCEVCGRPIGDERLLAMPAARHCVEDQAKLEARPRPQ